MPLMFTSSFFLIKIYFSGCGVDKRKGWKVIETLPIFMRS